MCWTKAQIYISPRALVVPTSRVWYSLPSQPCLCLSACVSLPSPMFAVFCALPWKHSTCQPLHMLIEMHCLIVADFMPVELAVQWEKAKKKKKKPFVFNICRNYINLEPSGWIASLIQTLEKNTCWASWSFVRDSCRGSDVQIAKLAPLFRIGRDINIMSCAAHQNCTAPSKRSGKYIMKLMTWFIHATSFCIMFSAKDHVTGVFSALPLCLHYIYEAVTVLWVCLCI